MEKKALLYEGKAKRVFLTDDPSLYIIEYKDTATAFNGEKKEEIEGKAVLNCAITCIIYDMLEAKGIKTHHVKKLDDKNILVKKVEIVPLEVIIRNVAAGSFSKRFGVAEGTVFKSPTLEYCLKDDSLGDPMVNDSHIIALGIATQQELDIISNITFKINDALIEFFDKTGIRLIDFKIEFGRTPDGEIILADEISPDSCRLWDKEKNEKLDKDRFRRDMGNVIEAYQEVFRRISN